MGCIDSMSVCTFLDTCCKDNEKCKTRGDGYKRCTSAAEDETAKEVRLGANTLTRGLKKREVLVKGGITGDCTDNDVALISLAESNGVFGAQGCWQASEKCYIPEVANVCPSTCATETGCSLKQESSLAGRIVSNDQGLSEIIVLALAVIGGVTLVAKTFTRCKRSFTKEDTEEYKPVIEKNSEEM